jgi:hypothetical protein
MKGLLEFLMKAGKYLWILVLIGIAAYGLYLVFSGNEIQNQILPNLQ